MFTQCPHCDSIFQLSTEQLKAANGEVRCGQCLTVFSALSHLSENIPTQAEPVKRSQNPPPSNTPFNTSSGTLAPPSFSVQQSAQQHRPSTQLAAEKHESDAETQKPDGDIFNEVITEASQQQMSLEEMDQFEEFLSADPAHLTETNNETLERDTASNEPPINIQNEETIEPPATSNDEKLDDTFNDSPVFADTQVITADWNTAPETDDGVEQDVEPELETEQEWKPEPEQPIDFDDEFAEFKEYAQQPGEATDNNFADFTPEQTPEMAKLEAPAKTKAEQDQTTQADTPPAPSVPSLLLEELQAAEAERLRPSATPWVLGSLILALALALQVAYHSRDELAKNAELRPWLIQMCQWTHCQVSQPYDVKQIDIIGREVRSHPSENQALIASTTLINNAPFVQPFPLLTLVFSDINGKQLARRRFTPREYLDNSVDLTVGMVPDTPVRIELELVDPGKAAVNYEFHTEPNPRTTRPLT